MFSLLQLPPELLLDILSRLQQNDMRPLRLASRMLNSMITPFLFSTVSFDLEPEGCNNLVSIASNQPLNLHVKSIRLRRRAGLIEFNDFRDWENANVYEFESRPASGERESTINMPDTICRQDWNLLSEKERRSLYAEYERDRQAADAYLVRLAAAATSMIAADTHGFHSRMGPRSDAERTLQTFISAVRILMNVQSFVHDPAYLTDELWGHRWYSIVFHPDGLASLGNHGDDPDIDSIQAFIALRTVLQAPNSLQNVELFSMGRAFWGLKYLYRLLDWSNRHSAYASTDDDEEQSSHGGVFARDLIRLEKRYSRLLCFACRIETCWTVDDHELHTIAKALSRCIREATQLQRLDLVIRDHACQDDFVLDLRSSRIIGGPDTSESLNISKCLLLDSIPNLTRLNRLHLSLATAASHLLDLLASLCQLQHLAFRYTSLLPNHGQWESVLEWVGQNLKLDSIALHALEDVYAGRPRLLFAPQAPDESGEECYKGYEKRVLNYVLGLTAHLPPLYPSGEEGRAVGQTASRR